MKDPELTSPHYNDLDGSLDYAWSLIEDGANNRRSAFHTPAVSTVSDNGTPQSRILVLRHADKAKRLLRFNSDTRSPKVAEIAANSKMSVLLYDSETKVQLRLSGNAHTCTTGPQVDEIWHNADRYARRCYMTQGAPSSMSDHPTSGLPASVEGRKPEESELIPARDNFALLIFEAAQIDWLYLATQGHRRARWVWRDGNWQGSWAFP